MTDIPLIPPPSPPSANKPEWIKQHEAAQALFKQLREEGRMPMPNKLADRPKPRTVAKELNGMIVTVNARGNPAWQRGMASPNPQGRPPGIRERKAKITERLLDQAGAVIDVMLQKALVGDAAAAALVINRVLPQVKAQLEKVSFTLDADQTISRQVEQVLAAIAKGEVAPDVGKKIVEVVESLGNVRAMEDLAKRIEVLEAKQV